MGIRVAICNRIQLYAEGLRRLLEEDVGIRVERIVGHDQGVEDEETDLLLVDVDSFARLSGRGRNILLIWAGPQTLPPFTELKEMVDQGLSGILDANASPETLRKAVRKVGSGELWFDNGLIHAILRKRSDLGHELHLSRREVEVLHSICLGCSNKQIADKLSISEHTVKTHCNHLFKKFGVTNRLQLALNASSHH